MTLPGARTTLDNTLEVETPELVILSYTLAGVGARVYAGIIDLIICVALLAITATTAALIVGPVVNGMGPGAAWTAAFFVLLQFAVFWGYYVLFEGLRDGQTPGKRVVGIRVVRDGGFSVTFASSSIRNIVRLIDMQPVFFPAVGITTMLFSQSGKRLGDFAAGTIVVRERALPARVLATATASNTALGRQVPSSCILSDREFDLLQRYVERRATLTPAERARTIARLALLFENKVAGQSGSDASNLLRLFDQESAARAHGAAATGSAGAQRARQAIVAESAAKWHGFSATVQEFQKRGLETMPEERVSEFVASYRALAGDLARLRTASRGGDLTDVFYLSRLVAAGHNLLYRDSSAGMATAFRFLVRDIPREVVRSARPIAAAALLFFGPAIGGFEVLRRHPDLAAQIVPASMIERAEEGMERARSGTGYISDPKQLRPLMGSIVMTNNITVAFAAFALGLTVIGTPAILMFNGVEIGAVAGLYASKGIGALLLAFVAPHGVLELTAICIAGASGLLLAGAFLMPGSLTRREALVVSGKRAIKLVGCSVLFLLVAGALEGLVSPIPNWPLAWKLMVSLATLVGMAAFVALGFRSEEPTTLHEP